MQIRGEENPWRNNPRKSLWVRPNPLNLNMPGVWARLNGSGPDEIAWLNYCRASGMPLYTRAHTNALIPASIHTYTLGRKG